MVGDLEGAATEPESPTGWNYPPREALAYQRGLFDDLPPGLEAPRWFGHAEPGGQHQAWLEDLGSDAIRWRLDDYGKAGRARGSLRIRANGDESVRGRGASRRRSYAGLPVPPSAI
jgi:hypothetical protein